MSKVIVIGGGAAGMFAALHLSMHDQQVILLEKNEKLGKKLFITGKGRCNLTNACDPEGFFAAVLSNPKFLYSSFYGYDNFMTMGCFEELGLALKTERGERVFPESDHSSDVIGVLQRALKRNHVDIRLHSEVKSVLAEGAAFTGVLLQNGEVLRADHCIIATGGLSYPSTGSTGDGYRFAEKLGIRVTETVPALVPMETKEEWVKDLQGLSLRNVTVSISDEKKKLYEEFGEMLFTHFGVSGPLILSAASVVGKRLAKKELTMHIDLKPALSTEQLDERVLRDFSQNQNKNFRNAITKLYPSGLIPVMIKLSGIDPYKKVNEITKEERNHLVTLTKCVPVTLTALRGYNEAIITKGGVSVKDINPTTMETKKIRNLYFAGEVLDLDAKTGGFNLQIAWSTAYAAAASICSRSAEECGSV